MIKRVDRADGPRWQVYAQRKGRKAYVGSYESLRAATEAEQDYQVTQRKIDSGELAPNLDIKRTFSTAVKLWLKSLEATGSRSHGEYARRVKNHMLPTLRDVPIASIQKTDIVRWRDSLNNGAISPATINTVLAAMSSAFSYFVDQQWINTNPCRGIKELARKHRVFPWLESSEAITRLLSRCTPNIRNLVAVLVGTGMRLDEALHLKWDDVDISHRIITVHRGRKGTTKSGRMRRVPIFDSVLVVLKEMRLARGEAAWLWPGKKPGAALAQSAPRHPFKRAARQAGLPPTMRIHDLRHSFASLFLIDGGDIFKLSRILGHSSVTITERTYAHLKPDAFDTDYARVSFRMPTEAKVIRIVVGDNRETSR